MKWTT